MHTLDYKATRAAQKGTSVNTAQHLPLHLSAHDFARGNRTPAPRRRRAWTVALTALAATLVSLAVLASPAFARIATIGPTTTSSDLTVGCVELSAELALNEEDVSYYFEYITARHFEEDGETFGAGTITTPEKTELFHSGQSRAPYEPVSEHICGLSEPRVTYFFRVVALDSQTPPSGVVSSINNFNTLNGPSHQLSATFGSADSNPPDPYPLVHPTAVAVDQSTGDFYVTNASADQGQTVTVSATGGTFTLTFEGKTTEGLKYDATASEVQSALESLPTVGTGNLTASDGPFLTLEGDLTSGSQEVTGVVEGSRRADEAELIGKEISGPGIAPGTTIERFPGGGTLILSRPATETVSGVDLDAPAPYEITFAGSLAETELPQLSADSADLTGPTPTATTSISVRGGRGADVEKFGPSGEFLLMFGKEVNKTAVVDDRSESEQDVCARGEDCQPATPGPRLPHCGLYSATCESVTEVSAAQFNDPTSVAVDNSTGPSAGDVYVGDFFEHLVQKFGPSGRIVSTWGEEGKGQKDGREVIPQGAREVFPFGEIYGVAVDSEGFLYVGSESFGGDILKFDQAGNFQDNPCFSTNNFCTSLIFAVGGDDISLQHTSAFEKTTASVPDAAFDPSDNEHFQDYEPGEGSVIYHDSPTCDPVTEACEPVDAFGAGQFPTVETETAYGAKQTSGAGGLAVDAQDTVYVANSNAGDVLAFADVVPFATTEPAKERGETSLTLAGRVDPENRGEIVECRFEWGLTKAYGHSVPCDTQNFDASTEVTGELTGLTPITELPLGTKYHYRLIATNVNGATGEGRDQTAETTAPPEIEGVSSSHLTATSAELDATIKPYGLPTRYYFQYGPTTSYGQTSPTGEITGDAGQLSGLHKVAVSIEGLQPGVTYHFRLLVENELDRAHPVVSEDHSFEFAPPACPNSAVRQETGSAYLPDCRAYELVSPGNANATLLYPGGPNTGQATSPSRFSFTGLFGSFGGNNTINTGGDLYVSTRTDTGWVSKYLGLAGSQAGCMGGPPTDGTSANVYKNPPYLTNTVLTDPSMDRFLAFNDGGAAQCTDAFELFSEAPVAEPSNAPYLFGADGTLEARLPSDIDSLPGAAEAPAAITSAKVSVPAPPGPSAAAKPPPRPTSLTSSSPPTGWTSPKARKLVTVSPVSPVPPMTRTSPPASQPDLGP